MSKEIEKWVFGESQVTAQFRIFSIRTQKSTSPLSGVSGEFYVIDTCDWINIIPITEKNEVVMVRQYRHGTDEVTLEIPGGAVDKSDGSPLIAAERELCEETGYSSDSVIHLGSASPNPAIINNSIHYYFAENARLTDKQNLDPTEEIQIELVPLADIPELIKSGLISHTLVVAAFHYFGLRYGFEKLK